MGSAEVAMGSDYGAPRELSSPLQKARALYKPDLPPSLQGTPVSVDYGDAATAADLVGAHVISQAFPHTYGQPLAHFLSTTAANVPPGNTTVVIEHPVVRVGVVFSGRQSPGGHNVIWGLYDAIKAHNANSKLIGFFGGTEGLFAQKTMEITDDALSYYKNQGGYDMLGRTKDQIRTTEQVKAAMDTCQALKLDALVIIGGVTSNTDAAQLAETFAESKCSTKVNLQLIGNACTDALSAEKSSSHDGQPLGTLKGWALAHRGKATSSVDFSPDDGPESYSNPAVHSRISEYTSMAREVNGPEWDPSTADIDGELAMRLGGGKKHGRYYIGDSVVDTAATPSLSQIRARSTSSSPAIRTRPSSTMFQLQALQAQLDEVNRQREEDRRRAEEDRRRAEENQQRMLQWMASQFGTAPPPNLFTLFTQSLAATPPAFTPNQSAASNEGPQDQFSPWDKAAHDWRPWDH